MFRPLPFVLMTLALSPSLAARADDATATPTPRIGVPIKPLAGHGDDAAKPAAPAAEVQKADVPPTMDERSKALLRRMSQKIQGTQALTADFDVTGQNVNDKQVVTSTQTGHTSLQLMKPASLHLESTTRFEATGHDGAKQASEIHSISNANDKLLLSYWDPDKKLYDEAPIEQDHSDLERRLPPFFYSFFAPGTDGYTKNYSISAYHYTGTEQWQGKAYQVVEGDGVYSGLKITSPTHLKLWIGDDDIVHHAVFQLEMHFPKSVTTSTTDYVLNKVELAKSIDKKVFAYRPPADAKKISIRDYYAQLASKPPMENGTVAPDFTVYDAAGKPVKLSDYRGKVVVLDYWATWCGPCQASLPDTNAAAKKFHDKNVVFLAINVWDKKDAFDQWLPQHKQLDALDFVIDTTPGQGQDIATKLYHVTGIPTQFVIGKDGKIAKSIVGNSGSSAGLESALQTALTN